MELLLTSEADRAMFKLVYPFSPALMQTLVAVSSALQRERTALKIMLQLLVNRRDTLRLGDVIPLGDLWDVVAHGDEAFTDVMRVNFENAKRLYQKKLLPDAGAAAPDRPGSGPGAGRTNENRREAPTLRERRPARQEPAAVRPGPWRRVAQEHDLHAAGCPEPRPRRGAGTSADTRSAKPRHALAPHSRTSDYCTPIGLARFGIILTETDEIAAINFVERVRDAGPRTMPRAGDGLEFNFGWASPRSGESADALVRRAEKRLLAESRS